MSIHYVLVENSTAILAHHRKSMRKGNFHLYPQRYQQYLHLFREALDSFKVRQREHPNMYDDRSSYNKRNKTSSEDLYPLELRLARKQLEARVMKARSEGHDAWIGYPAVLVVDGYRALFHVRPKGTHVDKTRNVL